jgi:ATP-binding cassette subfamily B (MDR/TAP) protein 1
MTSRIRQKFYTKLMYHDIAFFDDPDNNPGEIAANLESDTKYMNSLLTDIMGLLIKNFSTIIIAIFLSFSSSWRMSFCVLAVIPLMIINGAIQGKARMAMGEGEAVGSSIVQENVNNLKTVRAMNTMDVQMERFDKLLREKQPTNGLMFTEAIFYGVGQSILFFVIGFLYYVGALFMRDNGLSFGDFNKALLTLVFAGMAMGQASQFAGDSVQAGLSCVHIYSFLDQKKMIKEARVPEKIEKFSGRIEFKNASFKYPSRRDWIFRKMNCVINAGEDVAFCGPSGSGKSTIIQLLLRFYDLNSGEIMLDGINIKSLTLKDLRGLFGLVGQEPFLFNLSIRDNIKYVTYKATNEDIRQAAITSNAIDFIEGDERGAIEGDDNEARGYDRFVGVRGSKLSGGQKQRLAIARAVLTRPQAYLYDEATSALDSKSEQIVQTALNRLSENKTSISIAHRVSTIQDCDTIYVIGERVIKEQGSFDELMAMQGLFWKLNQDL